MDILRFVFPDEVRERFYQIKNPNNEFIQRLEILNACGPEPSDVKWKSKLRFLRVHKAAWEAYFISAHAIGLFKGADRNELLGRLRSPKSENFRSALAECMAAWFLAGKLKLQLVPRPIGRPNHPLEFAIKFEEEDIYVEVKAPFRERTSNFWSGNETVLLQNSID